MNVRRKLYGHSVSVSVHFRFLVILSTFLIVVPISVLLIITPSTGTHSSTVPPPNYR